MKLSRLASTDVAMERVVPLVLFCLLRFVVGHPVAAQQIQRDFRPRRVLAAQAAITDIPTKSTAEANRVLNPSELVLGVTIGKESRAYPINMLTGPSREIMNDQLGGQAIAATW